MVLAKSSCIAMCSHRFSHSGSCNTCPLPFCAGARGPAGPAGADGNDGNDGNDGDPGAAGTNGESVS